MNWPSASLE
ncbi:Protein of unknown function [Lactobacillus delbrueckii subsp. lactis]|nr:Putative uncharacterized protein [Lactobacillus delbrueckii subsp. lactis]CDR80951.1 Protein of unknown function [Lactobacillus delbrueckii subsp. lactis]CDR81774.1 Protein of unknown function [Lactobacillus delbrueckii subsp. lactis]CDR83740.1 Protein of unknown function [Lactobacillus delbrueckii subsp. lactis]